MCFASSRLAFTLAALSATALLLTTVAADAATAKRKKSADAAGGRDAAIMQCVTRAQQDAPNVIPDSAYMQRRVAVYKDCMTSLGFRP